MLLRFYRFDPKFAFPFSWVFHKPKHWRSACTIHPQQTLQQMVPKENHIGASFKSNFIHFTPTNRNISDVQCSSYTYIPGEINMPGPICPFFYKLAYKREADFCREVLHLLTKYFQMLKLIKNFLFALYWQIQLKSNLREHPPLGSSHSREFVVSLYIDVAAVWPVVSVGSGRLSVSVDVACRNL